MVLDEPTNHLDIWACESLEDALLAYPGTTVVVSHDRYFLNRVVDLLIVFHGDRVEVVHGNYDTYEIMRAEREKEAKEEAERKAANARPVAKATPVRAGKPVKPKRKFPYRKIEELEADIAAGETEVKQLEDALASPELYRDANRFQEAMNAFEAAKTKLAGLYEHWEEAVELN